MHAASKRCMHQIRNRLALGLLGGAAGLLVMEIVRRATAPLISRAPRPTDLWSTERTISLIGPQHRRDESSTDALGRLVYATVTGREPSPGAKRALSWTVHVGYGLLVAAGYVALRGGRARHALRDGVVFGAGLWLLGDELAVPLLGLADKPAAYRPSRHAQSLAQHLGFGIATAATTHAVGDWR